MKKICIVLLCLGAFIFCLTGCGEKKKYDEALSLFEAGSYEEAQQKFSELGDYEDSQQLVIYIDAETLYEAESYEEALEKFSELGDYKDSLQMAEICKDLQEKAKKYEEAKALFDEGEEAKAYPLFLELNDYLDSSEMLDKCAYNSAIEMVQSHYALGLYLDDPNADIAILAKDIEISELTCPYDDATKEYIASGKASLKFGDYTYMSEFTIPFHYNPEDENFNVNFDDYNKDQLLAVDDNGDILTFDTFVSGKFYHKLENGKKSESGLIFSEDGIMVERIYSSYGIVVTENYYTYRVVKGFMPEHEDLYLIEIEPHGSGVMYSEPTGELITLLYSKTSDAVGIDNIYYFY